MTRQIQELLFQNGFVDYLRRLELFKKDHVIILAVKDTIGHFVGEDGYQALFDLGLRKLGKNPDKKQNHWRGYCAIIATDNVREELGEVDEYVAMNEKYDSHAINVISAPLNSLLMASIEIDKKEYAVDSRGINIVVFSLRENIVVDSVCFDTHSPERKISRSSYFKCEVTPKNEKYIYDVSALCKRLSICSFLPRERTYQNEKKNKQVKVRIFFHGHYHFWNAIESVAQAFQKDDKYDLLVICDSKEINTLVCLGQSNIPYVMESNYDIAFDQPQIVINNDIFFNHLNQFESICLRALIPVQLVNGFLENDEAMQHDKELWQKSIKHDLKSDLCFTEKHIVERYASVEDGVEWIVSGNPKFDLIYKKINNVTNMDRNWSKLKNKKVILWAFDHNWNKHSVSFDLYAEYIFNFFKEREDLGLVIRPHPQYIAELCRAKIWSRKDLDRIKEYCFYSPNIVWDQSFDYGNAYACADAVITDKNCGIIISALVLDVPMAILNRFDGSTCKPHYEDLMEVMTQVNSFQELGDFIKSVANDEDLLKEKRNRRKAKYVANFDGRNGERIKERIEEEYYQKVNEKKNSEVCNVVE